MPLITPWTEERVKLLETWTEEGFSSSLIVDKFKDTGYQTTKNAVIGKRHRIGLYRKVPLKTRTPKRAPVRNVRKAAERKLALLAQTPVPNGNGFLGMKIVIPKPKRGTAQMEYQPDPTKRVLLRKTGDGHCRAIIGYANGVLADAICCGEEAPWIITHKGKLTRSPWCAYHRSIYVQPDTGRRK